MFLCHKIINPPPPTGEVSYIYILVAGLLLTLVNWVYIEKKGLKSKCVNLLYVQLVLAIPSIISFSPASLSQWDLLTIPLSLSSAQYTHPCNLKKAIMTSDR